VLVKYIRREKAHNRHSWKSSGLMIYDSGPFGANTNSFDQAFVKIN
jgi:hypothetical protein